MGDEPEPRTLKQKLLFYTTAFFILLGTFSLFAFLFLVPFVIDPAFTTIFMEFDENPAWCFTVHVMTLSGAKNCTWASCREGCTKDIFQCTQIRVNYKLNYYNLTNDNSNTTTNVGRNANEIPEAQALISALPEQAAAAASTGPESLGVATMNSKNDRTERDVPEYDYLDGQIGQIVLDGNENQQQTSNNRGGGGGGIGSINDINNPFMDVSGHPEMTGLMGNDSEWYYTGARIYPNVKGCGYPPMLNCTIWTKKYIKEGSNYSCYYSRVNPRLVITDLDMWQNTLNLIYAMAIPIPSFIISVIYLTIAYFKIYNEDEEAAPLDKNAEGMAGGEDDEENECDDIIDVVITNGSTAILNTSRPLTPNSDINSFGHQLKVKMADEMSRESLDGGVMSNSGSLQGNLSKTMTTSISTPPGPTMAV